MNAGVIKLRFGNRWSKENHAEDQGSDVDSNAGYLAALANYIRADGRVLV